MPDLDCLNKDMISIRNTLSVHTGEIDKLCAAMAENTKLTKENAEITKTIAEGTADIIDGMKWIRTTKKIILWAGGFVGGIWILLEGIGKFK